MQIGIDSFAAAFDNAKLAVDPSERLQDLIKQIERADQVGLDVFGVGEHHRQEFLDSAPAVILGAAAARTERIRLTSAVTVLSAADPQMALANWVLITYRGLLSLFVLNSCDITRRVIRTIEFMLWTELIFPTPYYSPPCHTGCTALHSRL